MTQKGRHSAPLVVCVQAGREEDRQIRLPKSRDVMGSEIRVANWLIPSCQEKPLTRDEVPVPQTDTGRQGEKPKARERTFVKELGKMTP